MLFNNAKSARLLVVYSELVNGKTLNRAELAQRFHVTERSIQRDIESLRCFFAENMLSQDIVYDRQAKGYRLTRSTLSSFTSSEILAICKILLESRSMVKEEMYPILDKLLECCASEERIRIVQELVSNEKLFYVEPHHGKAILAGLCELGEAVQKHKLLEIEYQKLEANESVFRTIEPLGLFFSEYNFYLVGFIRYIDQQKVFENPDDLFPTIYRVDRILSFRETGEVFHPPYEGRFREREFRNRISFELIESIDSVISKLEKLRDLSIDVDVELQSLQEIYLEKFELAGKLGVYRANCQESGIEEKKKLEQLGLVVKLPQEVMTTELEVQEDRAKLCIAPCKTEFEKFNITVDGRQPNLQISHFEVEKPNEEDIAQLDDFELLKTGETKIRLLETTVNQRISGVVGEIWNEFEIGKKELDLKAQGRVYIDDLERCAMSAISRFESEIPYTAVLLELDCQKILGIPAMGGRLQHEEDALLEELSNIKMIIRDETNIIPRLEYQVRIPEYQTKILEYVKRAREKSRIFLRSYVESLCEEK